MSAYELVVIGSGPGGYVAAIRAAQLGLKVACVERDRLGGVCLNVGCIPSKALLKSAEVANLARHLGDYGVTATEIGVDYEQVIQRSRKVASRSEKGVAYLLRTYGVDHIQGTARLSGAGEVTVSSGDQEQVLTAQHVIVATGARARWFDGMEPDGEVVMTYREAIVSTDRPESVVVLGAGAIGLEFAYFYNAMGCEVTLVEGADRVAPLEDEDISAALQKALKKQGIAIRTGVFAKTVRRDGDEALTVLADGTELRTSHALLALGVAPNVEELGLEALGVALEQGFVKTDASCRTSVPGVYAIGDVAGPPMLAHKASFEAHVCVERLTGHAHPPLRPDLVPAGTFCVPQVASVGRTEAQLADAGVAFQVGTFPFAANGKNRGTGQTEGFVKVLVDPEHGEFLGAHAIGDGVTELLAELVLAMSAEVDAETFLHAVHSHPTSAEAVMEAVANALGVSVHI